MRYAKGIMWLDDCRIPFEDTQNPATNPKYRLEGNYKMPEKGQISEGSITQFRSSLNEIDVRGRFTPNLLVCDDMLNDGSVCGGGKHSGAVKRRRKGFMIGDVDGYSNSPDNYGDKGSSSRYYDLDKWFDKVINEL
jgi:hypothetical protein